MKNSLKGKFLGALALVGSFLAVSSAHAQLLLINDSDPSNVVITATNGLSGNTISSYEVFYGIELASFFTDRTPGYDDGATSTTTLNATIHAGPLTLDRAGADYGVSGIDVHNDLALFSDTDNGSQTIGFSPEHIAFTGTVTFDLSDVAGTLPADGKSGILYAGSSTGGIQGPIGTYEVVNTAVAPEPATWLLLAGSLLALPFLRRLRRS
jgi:hypothetical protein